MKPIAKYILVDPIDEQLKTESGLILSGSDANDMRYKKASIVAVGTHVSDINVGDVIYYDNRSGYSVLIEDRMVTIILERDVVVVL
jgi:co-chaperonin GroES (HSP10)